MGGMKTKAAVAEALLWHNSNQLDAGIRGNDIAFSFENREGYLAGTVYANEPIGNKVIMTVSIQGTQLRVVAPNDTRAALDQPIYINMNVNNILYYDRETEAFITRHDQKNVTRYVRKHAEEVLI
jgi:multiple sugar transport system ATP-binding protein